MTTKIAGETGFEEETSSCADSSTIGLKRVSAIRKQRMFRT